MHLREVAEVSQEAEEDPMKGKAEEDQREAAVLQDKIKNFV